MVSVWIITKQFGSCLFVLCSSCSANKWFGNWSRTVLICLTKNLVYTKKEYFSVNESTPSCHIIFHNPQTKSWVGRVTTIFHSNILINPRSFEHLTPNLSCPLPHLCIWKLCVIKKYVQQLIETCKHAWKFSIIDKKVFQQI